MDLNLAFLPYPDSFSLPWDRRKMIQYLGSLGVGLPLRSASGLAHPAGPRSIQNIPYSYRVQVLTDNWFKLTTVDSLYPGLN